MNTMETGLVPPAYLPPQMQVYIFSVEGILCASLCGVSTEEWDEVDLSTM